MGKRVKRMVVALTEAEMIVLHRRADNERLSLSSYVRQLLDKAIGLCHEGRVIEDERRYDN